MFIHLLCLCPLGLTIKLNFNISKVAYSVFTFIYCKNTFTDLDTRWESTAAVAATTTTELSFSAVQIPRTILRQLIIAVMYTTEAAVKLKPAKIQASTYGIRTHDLCDTGTVLYQLSYQANYELVTL